MADFDEETDGTQSGLDNYLKSIQKTLSSTALTLESKTSAAEEAATKISQAYGLNLTDDELMSLAQAILDGKIQSEQDIIDFYTNLHDSASNAYDVFSRQAHDMIASLSFDNWAEGFTNASAAKTLTSGGTVSDLKDIWKQGADKWNETVTEGQITWTQTAIDALTDEQRAAMDIEPEVGALKDSQYWTSADYADYYKA